MSFMSVGLLEFKEGEGRGKRRESKAKFKNPNKHLKI